ncbi:MAG: flagellar biosynthesis protein [Alphaproteobacteria bacterium]|nr:flagellar biosynthesis protein [Alphaproteobacteria bacterium]
MTSRLVALLCVGVLLGGCAVNRSEINVGVDKSQPAAAATVPVKLVNVTDKRRFELNPRRPSIPSLKNGEINDSKITKRAIARKRNSYGMAMGDVLLPPGRTVEDLAREALVKALNEAGYRVLKPSDPGYQAAPALSADIHEFWSWVTPGFTEIAMEFKADVRLIGDWPAAVDKRTVRGYARVTGFAGTESMWQETINKGIDNFVGSMKGVLLRPEDWKPPMKPTS